MTDLRQAAEMALDALELECTDINGNKVDLVNPAIEALRQALEQGEQEFFAVVNIKNGYPILWSLNQKFVDANKNATIKLYTAPPSKPWVGLTDAEMESIWDITPPEYEDRFAFARAVEATLRRKNHG